MGVVLGAALTWRLDARTVGVLGGVLALGAALLTPGAGAGLNLRAAAARGIRALAAALDPT